MATATTIPQIDAAPVAVSTPSVTATPADWPACPVCHSNADVHRAGFKYRKQFPPAQLYSCAKCDPTNKKKFKLPNEARHKPGWVRRLKPIVAIEPIKAHAKVSISKNMFEMAKLRQMSVELYLTQLAESDYAETKSKTFKATSVLDPPLDKRKFKPIAQTRGRTKKIDGATVQRILYIYREGELSIAAIAERFGLGETTVNRVIAEYRNSELRSKLSQRATHHRESDSIIFGAAAKTKEATACAE